MSKIKVEKDSSKYHAKRRIFAVINNKLEVAEKNYLKSHDEWFIEKNWIKSIGDSSYEKITRGMLDPKGDLYFFVGDSLRLTKNSEEEFFNHLKELVEKLDIKGETKICGGMIRGENGIQWSCRKYFGVVGDFV